MYKVIETLTYEEDMSSISMVIWEGEDPSQYQGGLGCFDEGDHISLIEMIEEGDN